MRRWGVRRGLLVLGLALVVAVAIPLALAAQRGGGYFGFGRRTYSSNNVRYDGRFVFARIAYGGYGSWAYDYPDMEQNFTTILRELTSLNPHLEGSNIHTLDDPELLKFPVAYLTEPGYWYPDRQRSRRPPHVPRQGRVPDRRRLLRSVQPLRTGMVHVRARIRRVLPDARIDTLDVSHPVFNSFFAIKSLAGAVPGRVGRARTDGRVLRHSRRQRPDKRLMVVINYNMDIGDYMEWSATGAYAMAPTNEAYKFGINYVVYGLTH